MNNQNSCKKLFLAMIAVVVALIASDFLIHQVWLKALYQATAQLWRPREEMEEFLKFMFLGQIGVGVFFVWIFSHGYKGTGWKEGLRYGLLLGAFNASHLLVMYAVTPYPAELLISWVVAGMAQAVLLGIVASLIYRTR